MRRHWWLFGIAALLSGGYSLVMSGYLTERTMSFTLKHGTRQPTVDDQYIDLCKLRAAIETHDRRTATLRSLSEHSTTEGIDAARAAVNKRIQQLEPLLGRSEGNGEGAAAFDRTFRFFRDWRPPPLSCMSPRAHLWSTVIFWVTFSLGALTGLVRLLAGPDE